MDKVVETTELEPTCHPAVVETAEVEPGCHP